MWWVVVLPGEDFPEIFGPFRSQGIAEHSAEVWNGKHPDPDDRAYVLPLQSRELLTRALQEG